MIGSALWGFAEATLFFVVPDVGISIAAVRRRRLGLWCAGAALVTAVIGGCVMHRWGREDAASALGALKSVPAVSERMIEGVGERMKSRGSAEMFAGSVTGKPYKIYAVQAGRQGVPLGTFVVFSLAARAVRFFGVALLVSVINEALRRLGWEMRARYGVLAGAWVVIYTVFFAMHGW